MKINTQTILDSLGILDTFLKLSKFFPSQYKNYVRIYSDGKDNKLWLIVNNAEDMKIVQSIEIIEEETLDKVYSIVESYNIIKNILNYSSFELNDDTILFTDGYFSMASIDISEEMKVKLFGIDNLSLKEDNSFIVTEDIVSELRGIFRILNLKSDNRNSYFYVNKELFFNFVNVFIKKTSILPFLVTDIFSLRIISLFILKNKNESIKYDIIEDKLILHSASFYLETNIFVEDDNIKNYLQYYFDHIEIESEIKLKLEFFNFINTVNFFDDEASIIFNEDEIFIQSRFNRYNASFKIKNTLMPFSIGIKELYKIIDYMMKHLNDENCIEFNIVRIGDSDRINRFFHYKKDNVEILTEVV